MKDDKRSIDCIDHDGTMQMLDADDILFSSRFDVEVDNFGQISFGEGEPRNVIDVLLEQYRQAALQEALKVLVGVKEAFSDDAYVDNEIERVRRMLDFCEADSEPGFSTIFH